MSHKHEHLRLLREKANAVLDATTDIPEINTSNIDDLVHELLVYQTELEIQNEELQLAHQELQHSQAQYKNLFEFMPLAYLMLNEKGIVMKANPTASEQFGWGINELEGKRIETFIAPEYRDDFYIWYRNLLQDEIKHLDTIHFIRQDASRFYAYIEYTVNDSSAKNRIVHITISDITQRLRYQNRLQGLRELDRAILMIPNVTKIIALAFKHLLKLTSCADARMVFFHPDTSKIYSFSQAQDDTEMTVIVESQSEVTDPLPIDEIHIIHDVERKIPESNGLLRIPIYQSDMHIGYLGLREATNYSFTDESIEIAQDIAQQLGVGIQHARLLEQVSRHAQELEIQVDERTRELHESEQHEHIQRVFAEAMLDMTRSLNSTLDLDQVLERVLANLEVVIGYDSAEIILLENNTARIDTRRGKDLHTNDLNIDLNTIPPYKHILETGKKLWIDDLETINSWGLSGLRQSTKAYFGVPLHYDNETLGILNIYIRQTKPFSPLKMQYLEVFTQQATLAIKNAHQYQKDQQLVVLEERQRLARDLHDSVSQMLFSLTALAETLMNKSEQNPDILEHIVNLARGSQAEMRLLLFELNPANLEDMNLGYLLEKLVLGFMGHTQRQIELDLFKEPLSLSVHTKTHLFRIAQEALHNVIKHTTKGEIKIHLHKNGKQIQLVIEDQGEGFDLQSAQKNSRGLSNMRERAEEIGADFTLTSVVGNGTEVKISLNLAD